MISVKWESLCFFRGTTEVPLKNLNQYIRFIRENNQFKKFIFRGVSRESYGLKTSFQRRYFSALNSGRSHLDKFKVYSRGRIDLKEQYIKDNDEWWAIGQHHGLATPLLDWTASPFVALYFAFRNERIVGIKEKKQIEESEEIEKIKSALDEDRAVYFLNTEEIKSKFYKLLAKELNQLPDQTPKNILEFTKKSYKTENPTQEQIGKMIEELLELDFYKALSVESYLTLRTYYKSVEAGFIRIVSPKSGENARLINQRGLFTKHISVTDLEKTISAHAGVSEKYLIKVKLPNSIREHVLKYLDSNNINDLTLFPDLEGSSLYTNTKDLEPEDPMDFFRGMYR